MKYRSEIDGLRAVAVIPVILFHADFDIFSGGYVGVDVFFVLSGYLISGIILHDLQRDRFSIARFYERRTRRILPALFLTLTVCSVAAWYWFLPRDMKDFSQSLAASALFLSNFLFLQESAYFDIESELKPLLHTWSLAIEEQYYILFPLFFGFLFRRLRRHLLPVTAGLILLSFGWSIWQSIDAPQRAYFQLSTRIWELLVGVAAMLILSQRKESDARPYGDMLAAVGLALVLVSVFTFDEATLFPGPFAAAPVMGTALVVIYAQPGTRTARLLSLRPLVLIGLISYSAYLFHQPMLAFLSYTSPDEPDLLSRLVIIVAVFPLAWLSWKFIETPFRTGRAMSSAAVLRIAAACIAYFAILGVVGDRRDGYLRFDLAQDDSTLLSSLERSGLSDCSDLEDCLTPPPLSEDVLLLGDSNAFHFSAPLADALARQERRLIGLTRGGCFPSDRVNRENRSKSANASCRSYYRALFDYIGSAWPKPDTVLLSASWAIYYYGSDYFADNPVQRTPHQNARVTLIDHNDTDDESRRRTIRDEITSLLRLLSRNFDHVCVVAPMPLLTNNFRGGVPTLLSGIDGVSQTDFLEETGELLAVFSPANLPLNVRVLFPHDRLCSSGACRTQNNGQYLYSDINHISDYGARSVFAEMFAGDPACLGAGDAD
ncbi:acyltransferase family protein [Paracoccus aerodenitrificans]|uniref:acyltransferase family protein n=1 Tax=Paracoccus aerodenitrificans TaxID=3017781 RepID=UPI0022F086AC|nr:acyltransferase family protein [Paracoccus aerodenitrificans]WBU65353.1 acyltransferase family protein [Paracoccus aerodenitrificans]